MSHIYFIESKFPTTDTLFTVHKSPSYCVDFQLRPATAVTNGKCLGASGRQMLIHWGHVDTAEVSLLSAMCVLHHMDNQIIN